MNKGIIGFGEFPPKVTQLEPSDKIMKIYHWKYKGGKVPLRDNKGRFSSFKKFIKRCVVLSLIGFTIFTSFKIGLTKATSIESQNLETKIDSLKDKVVEDIRNCERSIYNESDAPIILDTNKKMSIGTFMYQKATIQHYYKLFYGRKITAKEATLIALDEVEARKLTKDIIFKDSKGWRNWYNCGVKNQVEGRIKIIKELE